MLGEALLEYEMTVGREKGLTDAEPDVDTDAEIVTAKEPNTLQSVGIEGLPAQVNPAGQRETSTEPEGQ